MVTSEKRNYTLTKVYTIHIEGPGERPQGLILCFQEENKYAC